MSGGFENCNQMKSKKKIATLEPVEPLIQAMRGDWVILDSDLAKIYGVETKALNRAVKRNLKKFPADFMFQISADEFAALRCQTGTLKNSRGQHRKYLPCVFTGHGAIMAANVLNSPQAVQMSVFVVRAFVRQREQLSVNAVVLRRLGEIDQKLLRHDDSIVAVLNIIKSLIAPRPSLPPPPPPKKRIGFQP